MIFMTQDALFMNIYANLSDKHVYCKLFLQYFRIGIAYSRPMLLYLVIVIVLIIVIVIVIIHIDCRPF